MANINQRDRVIEIFKTEKLFWELLAHPEEKPEEGYVRYKAEDGLILRDANSIIFNGVNNKGLEPGSLNEILRKEEPKRLIISPEYALPQNGTAIRGFDRLQLAEVFKGILFSPDPKASVYLWAEIESTSKSGTVLPKGLRIEEMNPVRNDKHGQVIRLLRCLKDKDIACAKARADLLTWTMRRWDRIPGFITYVLYAYDIPVGCVSCFRHVNGLTRIRDLFVLEEYRGRQYSAHLLHHVMQQQDGPFAVVTDCDNKARFAYLKRGLTPFFVLEAYQMEFRERLI